MYVFAILLAIFSLSLSAFCSGSETGFYRSPRIQLKLDAMRGDWRGKGLLALANRPSFFVATILVSNNVANYLFSMSGILLVQSVWGDSNPMLAEVLSTVCLAPVLFVYGEMFPKYLFLQAPRRFLRFVSPVLFFFIILLLPLTVFLWLANCVFAWIFGHSHEMIRLSLARVELARTFAEGHEAGVLNQTQTKLIDNVITISEHNIREFAVPIHHYPSVTSDMPPEQVLSQARVSRVSELPVFERSKPVPIGYVRVSELEFAMYRSQDKKISELPLRKLVEIGDNDTLLTTFNMLQTSNESLGLVLDSHKHAWGLVSFEKLQESFLDVQ